MSDLQAELRNLRKGVGVTRAKLERSPLVMRALGADTNDQAYELLKQKVAELGTANSTDALLHAYAFDMPEPGKLTERRADFGAVVRPEKPYHSDTIEAWENEAIDELAARLSSGSPDTDQVIVVGHYVGQQVRQLTASWTYWDWDEEANGDQPMFDTQRWAGTPGRTTPSCLIYILPPERRAVTVTLAALWKAPPYPTSAIHCQSSDLHGLLSFGEASVARLNTPTSIIHDFRRPHLGSYFGLFWEY